MIPRDRSKRAADDHQTQPPRKRRVPARGSTRNDAARQCCPRLEPAATQSSFSPLGSRQLQLLLHHTSTTPARQQEPLPKRHHSRRLTWQAPPPCRWPRPGRPPGWSPPRPPRAGPRPARRRPPAARRRARPTAGGACAPAAPPAGCPTPAHAMHGATGQGLKQGAFTSSTPHEAAHDGVTSLPRLGTQR